MTTTFRTKILNLTLIVLAIVAGVLGYFVYEKYAPIDTERGVSSVNTDLTSTDYSAMNDEELVQALPNSADVSSEAIQSYGIEVDARSVETDRVVISAGCTSEPAIAAVALDSTVVFANEDDETHTLQLTPDISLVIPAHKSKSVKIDFSTGVGMYGYPCDDFRVLAGMLIVR